jgi:multiple sugar transport system permease protein
MNSHRRHMLKKRGQAFLFALIVLVMITILFYPILVMISVSLKESTDVFTTPVTLIPKKIAWENYADVFRKMDVLTGFKNSAIVTGGSIIVTMLIAIPAAYALSKLKFHLKGILYYLILVSQMFAPIIVIIPLYQLLNAWGWIDTYQGLIAMNVTFSLAFIILMLKSSFDNVPQETLEAAQIDGCSRFMALVRVVVPISSTGIAVAVIFTFTRAWNEFLFAFTFNESSQMKTIIVKLYEIVKNNPAIGIQWHYVMAGAVMTTIPLVVLFICIRNYITGDATKGAIK